MVRGSGLKGLVSFGQKIKIEQINLIRPLLDFSKEDLTFISRHVFNYYVNDSSNEDEKYTRTRIRKLITGLNKNGLDKKKLFMTINNLKSSNQVISHYINENIKINSTLDNKNRRIILNSSFFQHPYEVVFRSLSNTIQSIGAKYYPVRGKKIDNIIKKITENTLNKETLGGCVIIKVNQTVIISKENQI